MHCCSDNDYDGGSGDDGGGCDDMQWLLLLYCMVTEFLSLHLNLILEIVSTLRITVTVYFANKIAMWPTTLSAIACGVVNSVFVYFFVCFLFSTLYYTVIFMYDAFV